MSTINLYFEQKYEKYQRFLSEHLQFLGVKFSLYLNRHVFVMPEKTSFLTCASNEDLNQPARPCSLIRVFVINLNKLCILLRYPKWAY